jgi:hypothetical protein
MSVRGSTPAASSFAYKYGGGSNYIHKKVYSKGHGFCDVPISRVIRHNEIL